MVLRFALLIPLCLLLCASPAVPPPRSMPVVLGKFQIWNPPYPLRSFTAGGTQVTVARLPCDARHRSEGCNYERINNQAAVTISAPGYAPLRIETDDQSFYYRIALVRVDARDRQPGVLVENESGGSGGSVVVDLVRPVGDHFERIVIQQEVGGKPRPWLLQGDETDSPRDRSGDGVIDLVLRDGRFGGKFGCNACTPRPPLVFTVRGNRGMDVSREPAFAPIFRHDMARNEAICRDPQQPERNGACAAYAADAARLDRYNPAARNVAAWFNRDGDGGPTFPAKLDAFLHETGYIG